MVGSEFYEEPCVVCGYIKKSQESFLVVCSEGHKMRFCNKCWYSKRVKKTGCRRKCDEMIENARCPRVCRGGKLVRAHIWRNGKQVDTLYGKEKAPPTEDTKLLQMAKELFWEDGGELERGFAKLLRSYGRKRDDPSWRHRTVTRMSHISKLGPGMQLKFQEIIEAGWDSLNDFNKQRWLDEAKRSLDERKKSSSTPAKKSSSKSSTSSPRKTPKATKSRGSAKVAVESSPKRSKAEVSEQTLRAFAPPKASVTIVKAPKPITPKPAPGLGGSDFPTLKPASKPVKLKNADPKPPQTPDSKPHHPPKGGSHGHGHHHHSHHHHHHSGVSPVSSSSSRRGVKIGPKPVKIRIPAMVKNPTSPGLVSRSAASIAAAPPPPKHLSKDSFCVPKVVLSPSALASPNPSIRSSLSDKTSPPQSSRSATPSLGGTAKSSASPVKAPLPSVVALQDSASVGTLDSSIQKAVPQDQQQQVTMEKLGDSLDELLRLRDELSRLKIEREEEKQHFEKTIHSLQLEATRLRRDLHDAERDIELFRSDRDDARRILQRERDDNRYLREENSRLRTEAAAPAVFEAPGQQQQSQTENAKEILWKQLQENPFRPAVDSSWEAVLRNVGEGPSQATAGEDVPKHEGLSWDPMKDPVLPASNGSARTAVSPPKRHLDKAVTPVSNASAGGHLSPRHTGLWDSFATGSTVHSPAAKPAQNYLWGPTRAGQPLWN